MRPKKFLILSAITAGSLAVAVVAITASSGTSQTAAHSAPAAQTGSFPPVNLDECPILHTGYPQGACVAQMQTDLRIVQDPNLDVDGVFGLVHSQTYNAVTAFQGAHDLPQDGMVGPATKNALKAALSDSSAPIPTVIPPTAPAPAPPGPASPVDHYTVELKAWIPQATAPATINSPVVCPVGQYMGAPKHYKGDDHTGYDGSYRVLVTYSFTWDGKEIGDVATDAQYGATHLMQDGCPDLVKTVTHEGDVTALGAASFQMHMSSENPIEPFAPTIDSTLKGTFTRPDELSFDLTSDKFPSHGFRVIKNGQIIATVVDFDASCKSGAESIALGLTAGAHGDWHRGHQDIDLNVPGQNFFGPCGQPRPPALTYP
jgi:hypothetical protein